MEGASEGFEFIAPNVTDISPVIYEGKNPMRKLEMIYSKFAQHSIGDMSNIMSQMNEMMTGNEKEEDMNEKDKSLENGDGSDNIESNPGDYLEQVQAVLGISDKKANTISSSMMQKGLTSLMKEGFKDGGDGLGDIMGKGGGLPSMPPNMKDLDPEALLKSMSPHERQEYEEMMKMMSGPDGQQKAMDILKSISGSEKTELKQMLKQMGISEKDFEMLKNAPAGSLSPQEESLLQMFKNILD